LTFDCSMPETNTLNTKDVRMAKTENSGKVDSPSKGWDNGPKLLRVFLSLPLMTRVTD
jgi:hypothetical protein